MTGHRPGPMVRRGPRWSAGLLLAMAVAVLGAACGIPTDDEPEVIAAAGHEDLLFGTTTTSTPSPDDDIVNISLFFIGANGELESVSRPYEANPQVRTILVDLESAPREVEQEPFVDIGLLETAVPPGLQATLLAEPQGSVRVLQVGSEVDFRQFLEAEPPRARLAVSQLVCTFLNLGGFDEVDGVEIHDQGGMLDLTDSEGQVITGPATEADFNDCRTGTEEREAAEAEAEGEEAEAEDGTSATTTTTAPSEPQDARAELSSRVPRWSPESCRRQLAETGLRTVDPELIAPGPAGPGQGKNWRATSHSSGSTRFRSRTASSSCTRTIRSACSATIDPKARSWTASAAATP